MKIAGIPVEEVPMIWIALHHMTYFMKGTASCYVVRCKQCLKLSDANLCVCACLFDCTYVKLPCIWNHIVEYVTAWANVSIKTSCKDILCYRNMFSDFWLTLFHCSVLNRLPKWIALGIALNHKNAAKRDVIIDCKEQCSTRNRQWCEIVRLCENCRYDTKRNSFKFLS